MTKIKVKIIILVILLIILMIIFENLFISKLLKNYTINSVEKLFSIKNNTIIGNRREFRVLLWTKWYEFEWYHILDVENKCDYSNCIFTDNRTNLGSNDAILFHWYNLRGIDLPKHDFPHQKWVLFNMESPHYTNIGYNRIGLKKVDWIMSYRTDSDIFTPYGQLVKCKREWKPNYVFEGKTNSIAWFVSHCKTRSKRELYVKELQKYIDIDIYGSCGQYKCQKYSDNCLQMVEKKYKFYLSFENSLCKDYVTEKLFHYIEFDIIPVVMGSANYSSILPYHSYIDVFNFTSAQQLADYLKVVSNDPKLYNSYFEWKNSYCVKRILHNKNLCELCKQLNKNSIKNIVSKHRNRYDWWVKEAKCRSIEFIKNSTKSSYELVRN